MEMNDPAMLKEIYRLSKENNDMLHRMRRHALLESIVKFIFYILVLVVAPLWVYTTYLAPLVQNLQQTVNEVQGTNQKAQNEFQSFQNALQAVKSKIPGLGSSTAQ